MRQAIYDSRLEAVLGPRTPLHYTAGPDLAQDRPGHVRAGSALVATGGRLVVIQDDAAFLASVDPNSGLVEAIPLPAHTDGRRQFDTWRGNKMNKLDLEAAIPLGADGLLAFGSGSAPGRDRVLRVAGIGGPNLEISLTDAGALYRALAAIPGFAESGLNMEGAALIGADVLRLFQRGNGASAADLRSGNATCGLSLSALLAWLADPSRPPPQACDVVQHELGALAGVALGFTDAAAIPGGVLYLAAAEDTPNPVDDGPVVGVAAGVLTEGEARWTRIIGEDGAPLLDKAEGLSRDPFDPRLCWVVFDFDDPDRPTELAPLRLRGPWPGLP